MFTHIDEVLVLERRRRLLVLGLQPRHLPARPQLAPRGYLLERLELLLELEAIV